MSADLNATYRSPINTSPSKQLYSFSKATRFSPTKQPFCIRSCYDGKKSAFGKRTTTFGYGNKLDLVNREHIPPVGKYSLKDDFDRNKDTRRGYSFSKNKKQSILYNPQRSAALPGPGNYNQNRNRIIDKYTTLSYSMGSHLEDPMSRHQNPLGPGQYESIPALTTSGNYYVSKYHNSGCGKIGKSKRSQLAENKQTPGPGTYRNEMKASLNSTGIYFNSKYKNMEAGQFSKSIRPGLDDKKPVPGPGSYDKFSDFATINKSWMRASTAGK